MHGTASKDAEPSEFRAIATVLLHWPAEQGVTHIEPDGAAEVGATLRVGDADLIVARASTAEGAVGTEFANLLPYVFVDEAVLAANRPVKRENVGINQVPFTGTALELNPLTLDFAVQDDHPLAGLRPKRLVGAVEVRDGTFALGVLSRAAAVAGWRENLTQSQSRDRAGRATSVDVWLYSLRQSHADLCFGIIGNAPACPIRLVCPC